MERLLRLTFAICIGISINTLAFSQDSAMTVADTAMAQATIDTIETTDSLQATEAIDTTATIVETADTITIIGVGDIMLGTQYPEEPNYLPANEDCSPLMRDVKDILIDADITFGNLEGCFIDSIANAKKCSDPKKCYTFGMPTKFAECYVDAGFDVLSIANNHSGDFDLHGRRSTVATLQEYGIEYAGIVENKKAIFTKNGITYGFCAFAPNWRTVSIHDIAGGKQLVKELKDSCDIVIVSFHGGAEGKTHQHVTRETEMYMGVNRGNVYTFSHAMIDAGADVVFGHGPHVTRAVELYKDRLICYSLGNFCTYERFNLTGPNGVAPIVKVFMDKSGKMYYAKVFSTYQIDGVGTKKDKYNRALQYIKTLTSEDFPEMESVMEITNDGIIKPKK